MEVHQRGGARESLGNRVAPQRWFRRLRLARISGVAACGLLERQPVPLGEARRRRERVLALAGKWGSGGKLQQITEALSLRL